MMLEMYSVYDKQVKAFLPPFYVRSRGEALRSFTSSCNQVDHPFHKYPLDYELVYCGSFDDLSCAIVAAPPVRVISAVEVIADVADLVEPGAPRPLDRSRS